MPAPTKRRLPHLNAARTACGLVALFLGLACNAEPRISRTSQLPQFDVSTQSLPRFDNVDGATRTSRMDFAVAPPNSSVAFSMGLSNPLPPAAGFAPAPGGTAVDLGMRWRLQADAGRTFDVSAWRRMNPGPTDALGLVQSQDAYGARVEMAINSVPQRGFVADRHTLGFQLESGARISIKRHAHVPMLYFRNDF